ncbi:MAG: hypothetical protein FWF81_11500 [Defluviitaleaceae bacterium]|nr:hypothetical protein [Defluviitaleaceae bacterium]
MNKNIDFIIDAVNARGSDEKCSDCNDFVVLLQLKDFKELIALEIYESYFWDERHEFDIQLLRELVDSVSNFFTNPETLMQIRTGLLQTLPSATVLATVAYIVKKLKGIKRKAKDGSRDDSAWHRIEANIEKIDKELSNHDYVLTDEIESIFNSSREEIQPLLKLCGCRCYFDKQRSIWIKAGLSNNKVREILQRHRFKMKR